MPAIIVDTNVLIVASGSSEASTSCIQSSFALVNALEQGTDRLAVDAQWKILGEYYSNLTAQDLAYYVLNALQQQNRVDYRCIEYDDAGHATLPADCVVDDPSDRKFVAVALTYDDPPPIYNATDSDWMKLKQSGRLASCPICVIELCEQ